MSTSVTIQTPGNGVNMTAILKAIYYDADNNTVRALKRVVERCAVIKKRGIIYREASVIKAYDMSRHPGAYPGNVLVELCLTKSDFIEKSLGYDTYNTIVSYVGIYKNIAWWLNPETTDIKTGAYPFERNDTEFLSKIQDSDGYLETREDQY